MTDQRRAAQAGRVVTDLESLLDTLEEHVTDKAGKTFSPEDRELLATIVVEALLKHDGARSWHRHVSGGTLHDLREPLARVVELLRHDANYYGLLVALGAVPRPNQKPFEVKVLGAAVTLAPSPDRAAIDQASERYEALLGDLDAIARALPPPPARRGKGRPSKTEDLFALADRLATYWEQMTGQPFKQAWHNGEPTTLAALFVFDVVKFIDPKLVVKLPKVTEKVVANRRAASSRK